MALPSCRGLLTASNNFQQDRPSLLSGQERSLSSNQPNQLYYLIWQGTSVKFLHPYHPCGSADICSSLRLGCSTVFLVIHSPACPDTIDPTSTPAVICPGQRFPTPSLQALPVLTSMLANKDSYVSGASAAPLLPN